MTAAFPRLVADSVVDFPTNTIIGPDAFSDASRRARHLRPPTDASGHPDAHPHTSATTTSMAKRKAAASSSDEEDYAPRVTASSPDRPLQTARRSGKKAKVRL